MSREYIPIRKMRQAVELGMNPPKEGRFGRVRDAFARDAVYWGDNGDWFIIVAQHRDSDSLTRSNFQVLLKRLGGEGERVAVERANHWAVGWVEYLMVHPHNRQGLRVAIQAHCSAYDYPVLDESHWSELEYNEAYEWAERELKELSPKAWWNTWRKETENCGFSDDEAGSAIERCRERLELAATKRAEHAARPKRDPNQRLMFPR